jgi:hypothetical protein
MLPRGSDGGVFAGLLLKEKSLHFNIEIEKICNRADYFRPKKLDSNTMEGFDHL